MKLLKAIHNFKRVAWLDRTVVAGCKDMKLLKAIHNDEAPTLSPQFVVAGCKDMKLLKAIHNVLSFVDLLIVLLLGAKI